MIKIIQFVVAVPFFVMRSAVRLVIWPVGVVWSYFALGDKPQRPDDLHLADKPVMLEGTNGVAVLLLHGWTSTAYEMRPLAKRLNDAGYTVHAPILPGHGTVPRALEDVTHQHWIDAAQWHYEELRAQYAQVFVGGMSMGGSLALTVAENNKDVAGVIAMGTPVLFRRQRLGMMILKLMRSLKKYERKRYPIFGAHPQVTQIVSYQTYPIDSVLEVYKVVTIARKSLHKIRQPILVLQSAQDHIVTRSSIYEIYLRVRSRMKVKKLIPGAYHNFIADIQHSHIHEDILAFLEKARVRNERRYLVKCTS